MTDNNINLEDKRNFSSPLDTKGHLNRIKTLCIILLVVFFGSLYQGAIIPFTDGLKHGIAVANYQIDHQKNTDDFILMDVKAKDINYMEESETNLLTGEKALTIPTNMTVLVHSLPHKPQWWWIFKILNFICTSIALVLGIWIPFLVVKVVRSLQHSDVFDRQNLKRINRIGIILIVLGVLSTFLQALNILSAQALVDLAHYKFTFAKVIDFNPLTMGIVILIMNEILHVGTDMKEEQELTI